MRGKLFRFVSLTVFSVVLLAIIAGAAVIILTSPPTGTGRIAGITLNLPDAFIVITRHHLDCEHDPPGSRSETCTVALGDEMLTVNTVHGDMNQFSLSECRVVYRGEDRFCYGRVETTKTPPFAVITSLDIPDNTLADLQRRYALTSRQGEAAWWQLTTHTALILAASSAPLSLSYAQGTVIRRLGVTAISIAGVFLVGLVLLRFALFTTGFVD